MASADDAQIAERASSYRATIRDALFTALAAEPGTGETEALQRANALLAAVLGLHITARSSSDPAEAAAMVDAVRTQVQGWR